MSNASSAWLSATESSKENSLLEMLPVMQKEFWRRPVMLAGLFAGIALLALVIGMLVPKRYTSSTTILVEDRNIITPLMEGRAVATSVVDRASILREVAFSRKVMDEILKTGGWLQDNPSPLEQEKLIEKIVSRTSVTNPSANLTQISYTDSDPDRAYQSAKRYADLVIQESLTTKERESSEAYEFIDSQVRQYHAKLTEAETKLENYRNTNPDARPGVEADVNSRIGELRRIVETDRLQLIDLRSQESALRSQLSGESEISTVQTRSGQFRARLAELQTQRDQLMMTFTEQHPDVTRVTHQIRDVEEELRNEEARRELRRGQGSTLDGTAMFNPLHAELRSRLAEASRSSSATAARVSTAQDLLEQELARSGRIASSESALAELTRDYEVNRDLYQDLLRRRENARVSMNLDAERRGLSFRIQEPAAMPLLPSGLRTMHIAGGGLLLGLLAPLGFLFGLIKYDPRVRSARQIERATGLTVLNTMPMYRTQQKRRESLRSFSLATLLILAVPGIYLAAYALKSMEVL